MIVVQYESSGTASTNLTFRHHTTTLTHTADLLLSRVYFSNFVLCTSTNDIFNKLILTAMEGQLLHGQLALTTADKSLFVRAELLGGAYFCGEIPLQVDNIWPELLSFWRRYPLPRRPEITTSPSEEHGVRFEPPFFSSFTSHPAIDRIYIAYRFVTLGLSTL